MASDSRKASPEKHQQVPERYWFLIGVIGFSFIVVNVSSPFFSLPGAAGWAIAETAASAINAVAKIFLMIIYVLFTFNLYEKQIYEN